MERTATKIPLELEGRLRRLIEISLSIAQMTARDEVALGLALEERGSIIASLSGPGEQEAPAGDEIEALVTRLKDAEAAAAENMEKILSDIKASVKEAVTGRKGLSGYSGALHYLSRFTDKKC